MIFPIPGIGHRSSHRVNNSPPHVTVVADSGQVQVDPKRAIECADALELIYQQDITNAYRHTMNNCVTYSPRPTPQDNLARAQAIKRAASMSVGPMLLSTDDADFLGRANK